MPIPQATPWPSRFYMLDGWRGLAAVTVVLTHVTSLPFKGHHITQWPIGHYAVILFFVISGYCITASAQTGLRKGMSFLQFLARRIRRIYPPYLLSVLFFTVTRLVKVSSGGANQLQRPPLVWLQNLTLTQWLSLIAHPQPVPYSNLSLFVAAYWSLNYEEQFYLVMAMAMAGVILWKLNLPRFIVALTACALLWNLCLPNLCYGIFIEYWAHFAIGALLYYRLCQPQSATMRKIHDGFLILMAIACGLVGWHVGPVGPDTRTIWGELFVASSFALLLIALRPGDDRFRKTSIGVAMMSLGTISYSLYLIHQFNLVIANSIAARLVPANLPIILPVIVQTVIHILIALPFWFLCERPFLNKINEKSTGQISNAW